MAPGIVALMFGSSLSLADRAAIVAGPLAPLAASLAADLDRLLPDEDVFVPVEKARMTRRGGRCEKDGAFLEFDPRQPRRHRCPVCGTIHDREEDYRWWIMGYQLWLSERTVHAAALWRVTRAPRYRGLAEAIMRKLARQYTSWPNEDNVLGPTRVFFSTYLESIWSLQLSVAVWLLEDGGAPGDVGQLVRESILAPSSELVASFDEGLSNRQVWNSAALGAAGLLLGRSDLVERALVGGSGLQRFLRSGLLRDGTWYEGENYHLFAHRGLWYLVMMAEHARALVPDELMQRFASGFVAPLMTALPDFTFPSRRDSQYRASLRQWRIAESLELGLARSPDSPDSIKLAGGLGALYGDAPSGDPARWRSTAEAERNVPGVRLTRADLGWKSLLFALPAIGSAPVFDPGSALMEGQGFGVVRRDQGRVYAALDYGHTGGSHGHPDRLNLWLVIGDRRVFEDVGTGSYVDRTLHWYRSTLAHNAPLIDGRSQDMVPGSLRAWDEREGFSWIDAEAAIAEGVLVRRSLVVAPGFIVDRVEWHAKRNVALDLPLHLEGAEMVEDGWKKGDLTGGSGLEDGFDFVSTTERLASLGDGQLVMANDVNGFVTVDVPHEWWRMKGPGPPSSPERTFLLLRARGVEGRITSVWTWTGNFTVHDSADDSLDFSIGRVRMKHQLLDDEWHIQSTDGGNVVLRGRRKMERTTVPTTEEHAVHVRRIPLLPHDVTIGDLLASGVGLRFELGRSQYRRTEATWLEAGSPTATVMIAATTSDLLVEVSVNSTEPNFVPARLSNALDNEHPDTNSDGVQLHLKSSDGERILNASWLMVPEPGSAAVRWGARDDAVSVPMNATWRRTENGWQLLSRLSREAIGSADAAIGLDVIVNEMPKWRERRRGQLVMSATKPTWAYLRGDRQELDQLIPMMVRNV